MPNFSIGKASAELVLEIVGQLTRRCGPVVVFCDAEDPVLITPDYTSPINW